MSGPRRVRVAVDPARLAVDPARLAVDPARVAWVAVDPARLAVDLAGVAWVAVDPARLAVDPARGRLGGGRSGFRPPSEGVDPGFDRLGREWDYIPSYAAGERVSQNSFVIMNGRASCEPILG